MIDEYIILTAKEDLLFGLDEVWKLRPSRSVRSSSSLVLDSGVRNACEIVLVPGGRSLGSGIGAPAYPNMFDRMVPFTGSG